MSAWSGYEHLPADVKNALQILENNFKDGDITIKGYCKEKFNLLNKYLPAYLIVVINTLQYNAKNDKNTEPYNYLKISNLLNNIDDPWDIILNKNANEPSGSKDSILKEKVVIKTKGKKNLEKENVEIPQNKNTNQNSSKRKNSNSEKLETKKLKTIGIKYNIKKNKLIIEKTNIQVEKCDICKQYLNRDVLKYAGHPEGAMDELVALTDPKLMLFTGEENQVHSKDTLPHNKVTQFNIYDKNGHLCPIDSGLIEQNCLLYFSGYLKPIYDDNPSTENGVPAKDMGPINEWWSSGFDGGEKALIGLSTAYGEYYLMEPSPQYSPLLNTISEKIYLSKLVIEFLLRQSWKNPTYEDLLVHLNQSKRSKFGHMSEENLLQHAQFICDQVTSFDAAADQDDELLIVTDCMRALVKLAGVTFAKRQEIRKNEMRDIKAKLTKRRNRLSLSKATTTELVKNVFESIFPQQIDGELETLNKCGECAICQLADCGECTQCRANLKLGKTSKSKKPCSIRRCTNIAISNADNFDSESDDIIIHKIKHPKSKIPKLHTVKWTKDPISTSGISYYTSAIINKMLITAGDFIILTCESKQLIAKVVYLFEDESGRKLFHSELFSKGADTILGLTADSKELFALNKCDNQPLGAILSKVDVKLVLDQNTKCYNEESNAFFYSKSYNKKLCRFEDVKVESRDNKIDFNHCNICCINNEIEANQLPVLSDNGVEWKKELYTVGLGVYLKPGSFKFKTAPALNSTKISKPENVDEEIYPEFYRKKSDTVINQKLEIFEPFCIAYITEILPEFSPNITLDTNAIKLKVQKIYRPENTHKGVTLGHQLDLNLVYWSEEQLTIPFSQVIGRCHLAYSDILDVSVQEWSAKGPDRFYFTQNYNVLTKEFLPVTKSGQLVGKLRKGLGKGKSNNNTADKPTCWPILDKPLRCMDVFAGCGGLSKGLHQSGVADTKWAIEKEQTAAQAFKLNNPDAIVYTDDCNEFLKLVIAGATKTNTGQPLPKRGDVELLCGGPPCQGFSGMNRFNAGEYSVFKNSLIVSYLSFCDYYRPKYFILENVRNFATYKQSMVLKLTLRCLLAMGYQCTFGVLQAGNYGVAQTRRRTIVFAAAPGEQLPRYPEPTHVFYKKASQLGIVVDNFKYITGSNWLDIGAPYRMITVRDAMSDLPAISNGCSHHESSYDTSPESHFQRLVRGTDDSVLRDHVCKEMAPIIEARMAKIPTAPGSDWRDLPNIVIRLSDMTYTQQLVYRYHDKKSAKTPNAPLRGVCACIVTKACDQSDRQFNTLIPWCLPHTANRHNHWPGLYGRLDWAGVFSTTVTNPEPMGKQGKVLHPEQHRVVSVRECARSQGFPDTYQFYGNILDKHRQVGNAVPPPLGLAIGREILRAIVHNI